MRTGRGQNGGKNATAAYRKYVKEGIHCIENPFKTHLREWVFGSADFLNRMIALAGDGTQSGTRRNRKLRRVEPQSILDATAKESGCDASGYAVYRSGCPGSRTGGLALSSMDIRDATRIGSAFRSERHW